MAVAIVQHDQYTSSTTGNELYFSAAVPVTSGSTVLVIIHVVTGTGTFTGCSDPTNGAYTVLYADDTNKLYMFLKRNVTGFAGSVTAVCSDGTSTHLGQAYELSGCDNRASVTTDAIDEAISTSHVCATTGFTGTGFFVGLSAFSGVADITPGAGYSLDLPTNNGLIIEYVIKSGSAEKAPFTTSLSVSAHAVMTFIPELSTAPPPATLTWLPRQQILRGPRALMIPSGPIPPDTPEP